MFIADNEKDIFAAGCFWGIEYSFQKHKGVVSTATGYTGCITGNPRYQDVCSGKTGHAEVVNVIFDPAITSFEKLVKHLFDIHNPALIGNHDNHRSQYRAAIFYANDEQKSVGEKLIENLKRKNVDVGTEIKEAAVFYKLKNITRAIPIKATKGIIKTGTNKIFRLRNLNKVVKNKPTMRLIFQVN